MAKGRGQLSSLDRLPPEAAGIVAWASSALADRDQTQTEIYAEFVTRCEALMAEYRGELEFSIPSFSSFNRYSVRQARMTRQMDQTREIVAVLAEKYDAKTSDQATIFTAELIKGAVMTLVADNMDAMAAADLKDLANAVRAAQSAQNMSAERRTKEEAKLAERVNDAIETVARTKGLTAETAEAIKAQILGV